MIEPSNNELIKGEIADYWMRPDGILISYSKSVLRTVENISENSELIQKISGGRPVPLLIYLKNSPMPDKATRKLSTELLPKNYSAMAMVSQPGLAHFIMKLLFSLKPSPIPIKSFTDDQEALQWLKTVSII